MKANELAVGDWFSVGTAAVMYCWEDGRKITICIDGDTIPAILARDYDKKAIAVPEESKVHRISDNNGRFYSIQDEER